MAASKEQWEKVIRTSPIFQGREWFLSFDFPRYAVSINGQVKNIYTGKLLTPTKNDSGYYYVKLYKEDRTQKSKQVHRFLMETIFPECLHQYEVNHKDFNKANNKLDNLEWVTRKENLEHFNRYGFKNTLKGSAQPKSKLKEKDIPEICLLYKQGMSIPKLAKKFLTSNSTIWYILIGKTWRHVERN